MTSNSHGIFFSTNTVSWKSDVSNKASPGKWLVSLAKAFGIRMRSRNLPSRVHSELCLCWQNTQLAARKHPCADTSSTNQKYRTRRGRAFQIKMSVREHRLSHPQTSSVCGSSGSSDGQEVTKLQLPQWRPSRSCHTYHPSIEARLPCDLHQGFCSSVCSVIARPRRQMGDASCLTEKMWSASVVFVSLHFWSRSSGSMFFFLPPWKEPGRGPRRAPSTWRACLQEHFHALTALPLYRPVPFALALTFLSELFWMELKVILRPLCEVQSQFRESVKLNLTIHHKTFYFTFVM